MDWRHWGPISQVLRWRIKEKYKIFNYETAACLFFVRQSKVDIKNASVIKNVINGNFILKLAATTEFQHEAATSQCFRFHKNQL